MWSCNVIILLTFKYSSENAPMIAEQVCGTILPIVCAGILYKYLRLSNVSPACERCDAYVLKVISLATYIPVARKRKVRASRSAGVITCCMTVSRNEMRGEIYSKSSLNVVAFIRKKF